MNGADILVIIVNFRTANLVIDCLKSLEREIAAYPGAGVTIVDNASGDGSADQIENFIHKAGWSNWANVVHSPVNGGFAYGNNLAVRRDLDATWPIPNRRKFYWLLNPDTIVRPGAIGAILAFLSRHPEVGAIGTAIDDGDGQPWRFAFRFHSLLGEVESAFRLSLLTRLLVNYSPTKVVADLPERVDWVSGASTVIRREVFETIGLLDEDYFLYFEETDYFRSIARGGWECWYLPSASVVHISGQSTGLTGAAAGLRRVPEYWFASRRRYLIKNHGRPYAILADLITIAGICQWRLRCLMQRRPHREAPHFLRDFIAQSSLFKADIRANRQLLAGPSPRGGQPAGKARSVRMQDA